MSTAVSVSLAWQLSLWAGEDMVLLGVFTTAAKQVSYLGCFPRSMTPRWALAPTYFASPCVPFSGLWVSSCC